MGYKVLLETLSRNFSMPKDVNVPYIMKKSQIYEGGVFETEIMTHMWNGMLAMHYMGKRKMGSKVLLETLSPKLLVAKGRK